MQDQQSLQEFILHCKNITRLSELWEAALDFFHSRGIEMVSYHGHDALTGGGTGIGIVEHGFPGDWVCTYIEKNLSRIDPIPQVAATLAEPFFWSETEALTRLTSEQKQFMEMRAASDLGDGLALEVYGPNMRNAYLGLGFGHQVTNWTAERIFELQCAAQIAHVRYCQITDHRAALPDLSPRELEVLRWIARGKSNSVIADIMGISRHTVDTMTRRLFDKLDVHDRVSAAVRGLGSGLVSAG